VDKRRLTTTVAKYLVNPLVRALFRLGVPAPGTALLETLGRKSGRRRCTPVTNGLAGDTFWIVTEHGQRSNYVRNIEVIPRVRVKVGGRWRSGTAAVVPGDDPRARLRAIAQARPSARIHTATVLLMQTELLTLRVDLDTDG
jgi:deazaflavin-dependent oxidoreductase (nitroreductase family)